MPLLPIRPLRGVLALVCQLLCLIPASAAAIQLRWSTGTSDLTISQDSQAVLVIEADSGQVGLPSSWRLLWTADSLGMDFAAFDPNEACLADTAKADSMAPPATPADSAANQITAWFCSSGSDNAPAAHFLVDLPGGGRGKLKVVALDPSDTTQIIESNEVRFNGGIDGEYPMAILRATSQRIGQLLRVSAIGSGLASANGAILTASNGLWTEPLSIEGRTSTSLVASATISANVPPSVLQVIGEDGAGSSEFPGSSSFGEQSVMWMPGLMHEAFTRAEKDSLSSVPPNTRIQPKDFAFIFAQRKFHLFYIRESMWDTLYAKHGRSDSTEKNFGHAISNDLVNWYWTSPYRDTTVLQVRPGKWDNYHVWAPYIVEQNATFYMFYTGVELSGARQNQSIGLATSTDLATWSRFDAPILTVFNVPWARRGTVTGLGQQLRDPFVMQDPLNAGQWLMYFVAVDTSTKNSMAVGVARSTGDFSTWVADRNPLGSTDSTHLAASRVESPHVFSHGSDWWLFVSPATPPSGQDGLPYSPVTFERTASGDPTNGTAADWTNPDTLYSYQTNDPLLQYWHGSEHLVVDSHEYLAAYDDYNQGIAISEMNWYGPHDFILGSASVAGIASVNQSSVPFKEVRLLIANAQPARSNLDLRVQLPGPMHANLAIFDVAGRRVVTLLDRDCSAGEIRSSWDGRNASGTKVGSGVYFARLSCPTADRVLKTVCLR